ncbi:MAG: hypothetical protein ACE5OZ_06360 [Candidatus Heimdallarchaeota archaeon]
MDKISKKILKTRDDILTFTAIPLIIVLISAIVEFIIIISLSLSSSGSLEAWMTLAAVIVFIMIIANFFVFLMIFSKNGLMRKINNNFTEFFDIKYNLEQKHAIKLNEVEDYKDSVSKTLANEEESLRGLEEELLEDIQNEKFALGIKSFLESYGINFDDDIFRAYFKSHENSPNFASFLQFVEENKIYSETILDLFYNNHNGLPTHNAYKKILENDKDLNFLMDILIKSDKLTRNSRRIPTDVVKQLLYAMDSLNIQILNRSIDHLHEFVSDIERFYSFLKEEDIPFERFSLWNDLLDWQRSYISKSKDIQDSFWEISPNTIRLNENWEFKDHIKEVIIYLHLRKAYPADFERFNKKISRSIESAKILFFILQNGANESLGEFIAKNLNGITRDIGTIKDEPFFHVFHSELKKGKLISDSNQLFRIYRDESSFDLSYLNHLFFNPAIPINFQYALDHYFTLNAPITSLLRNLSLEGREKLFLLTFASDGGIAEAINELANEDSKFPELAEKYDLLQYSSSARLGALNDNLPTLDSYKEEMKADLGQTIPYMKKVDKIKEKFEEFIEFCKEKVDEIAIEHLTRDFENYVNLIIDKNVFMTKLEEIYGIILRNDNIEEFEDYFNDLWRNLIKDVLHYPPIYQLLIHELEYDPKKIKVLGDYKRIDPFAKIKELFAQRIKDKELLLASTKYDENEGINYSIREINERLINSLTVYILVSKDVRSIQNNPNYERCLDEEAVQYIITKIYPDCKKLLEFCLKLSENLGLDLKRMWTLDDYNEQVGSIIRKNQESVSRIGETLAQYISLDQNKSYRKDFTPELLKKISSAFVKSCICIAVIIFQKILEALEILNDREVKKIKTSLLDKLDLEIIREKRFLLVFYTLLSLYRTNKIRPLFESGIKVSEHEFHNEVFRYLSTPFGDNIVDESKVAKGKLDIYAFKTPVELKVEDEIDDIDSIFNKHKAQFLDYLYKKDSKVGILYVYENMEKKAGYPKDDIRHFQEEDYDCIVIILRGNFPFSSKLSP